MADFDRDDLLEEENFEDPEEEENRLKRVRDKYNPELIKAAKEGGSDKLEYIEKMLDRGVLINFEHNKWNALTWAACRGHLEIVRLLLSKGAGKDYRMPAFKNIDFSNESYLDEYRYEYNDRLTLVKLGVPVKEPKNTPIMWACTKPYYEIICLLLKEGHDLSEVNEFGNNSVHMVASSNSLSAIELVLQFGVKLYTPNIRGHTVYEMASSPEVLALFKKQKETIRCTATGEPFKQNETKFFCKTCKNFFCEDQTRFRWVLRDAEAKTRDEPERKCLSCIKKQEETEYELKGLIETQSYSKLCEKLEEIQKTKQATDVILFKKAKYETEKLRIQIKIGEFIAQHAKIPDYKTILKSKATLQEILDDCNAREIYLDQSVMEKSKNELERLEAERNLRFELENINVGETKDEKAKEEEISRLETRLSSAKSTGVASEYCDDASAKLTVMNKNNTFQKTLKRFSAYPPREYPGEPKYDRRSKRWINPITGKNYDPTKPLILPVEQPKGKKKNKGPLYVFPPEYEDRMKLTSDIQIFEGLMGDPENGATPEDLAKAKVELARMKQEEVFRKRLESDQKIIDDINNKKKKGKK